MMKFLDSFSSEAYKLFVISEYEHWWLGIFWNMSELSEL